MFFVTATRSTWRSQKGLMGMEITHTLERQAPGETLDAIMEPAMLMAISASRTRFRIMSRNSQARVHHHSIFYWKISVTL